MNTDILVSSKIVAIITLYGSVSIVLTAQEVRLFLFHLFMYQIYSVFKNLLKWRALLESFMLESLNHYLFQIIKKRKSFLPILMIFFSLIIYFS